MRSRTLHPWAVTPREAMAIQRRLARQIVLTRLPRPVRLIAGADIALTDENRTGIAGVIVYRIDDDGRAPWSLREVERGWATGPLRFPYIPGLLSFREIPLLLQAFEQLHTDVDLILCDGQGIAHPRGLGLASHLGLLLDRPTIGCAKSPLFGHYTMPPVTKGAQQPLRDGRRIIGAVVRSRANVRPIVVSPGHRITVREAVAMAIACCDGYRIPKPTREADRYVAQLKSYLGGDAQLPPSPPIANGY